MDKLLEFVFEALFGVVIGIFGAIVGIFAAAVIIKIVKVVQERITRFNIGGLTKKALEEDPRTHALLSEAIKLAVEQKKGNTVSISALKQGKKVAEVQLQGESVAEDIKVGDSINLMTAVAY